VWFDPKPEDVRPCDPDDAAVKEYTREAPHVVFTPELRRLSQQIVGTETNPYWKAKKCYDWVGEHILYSYAIEYSTIRNISDYCRSKGYGDCGQEALLFIALCRLNGVPARWQSGWNLFSGDKSNHDWSEIYLAPYGWMPVDPYMGLWTVHYANTLTPDQKRELRDFYFGGLDQYRMIANSDHSQALRPPKRTMRSDDVDFQRGELEWDNHNLYLDQFSYSLTTKEVPLAAVTP
jgi:transglutaminase-like putative cysteine protease